LEQKIVSLEVEAQSLQEELQLGRVKYDRLLETNKHLESSMNSFKQQFEKEIRELQLANKTEVLALSERMESTISSMRTQHEKELIQLRTHHKQVESYVAKLTMEKMVLQDTIVDREVENDRLKRRLSLSPSTPTKLTVEEVSITAKIKDPDQEALAAGILLSTQNSLYGTNMVDSLREEDNAVIDQYIKQGFTRSIISKPYCILLSLNYMYVEKKLVS